MGEGVLLAGEVAPLLVVLDRRKFPLGLAEGVEYGDAVGGGRVGCIGEEEGEGDRPSVLRTDHDLLTEEGLIGALQKILDLPA